MFHLFRPFVLCLLGVAEHQSSGNDFIVSSRISSTFPFEFYFNTVRNGFFVVTYCLLNLVYSCVCLFLSLCFWYSPRAVGSSTAPHISPSAVVCSFSLSVSLSLSLSVSVSLSLSLFFSLSLCLGCSFRVLSINVLMISHIFSSLLLQPDVPDPFLTSSPSASRKISDHSTQPQNIGGFPVEFLKQVVSIVVAVKWGLS